MLFLLSLELAPIQIKKTQKSVSTFYLLVFLLSAWQEEGFAFAFAFAFSNANKKVFLLNVFP